MYNFDIFLDSPIVVFGGGSIGERHIRNLWGLGFHKIFVYRQRNLPFRNVKGVKLTVIKTWEEIEIIKPIAAIICSPSSFHLSQTIKCARLGIHVLVEKPLSHTTEGFGELRKVIEENKIFVYVGYMMRFHPLIIEINRIIKSNKYGNVISIQSKWAEYLPDWHPWEDYRETYAAKKNLGGGVALTLSHDIDLVNYLAGSNIDKYFLLKNYKSKLELDVESGIDLLIKYNNKTTANIHLNYYEKCKERLLKLVFDDASLVFEFYNNSLTIKVKGLEDKTIKLDKFDRNDLFIEQSKYFFSRLNSYSFEETLKQVNDSEKIIKICNNEL